MNFQFLNIMIALGLLAAILMLTFSPPPAHFHDDFQQQSSLVEREYNSNHVCDDLKSQMQAIDHHRTLLALEQVNKNLRLCLPLMTSAEQFKMMQISTHMYQKFMQVERNETQQNAFDTLALVGDPIHLQERKEFELLHPRDQYLLKYQGQIFIQLIHAPDGSAHYQRNPEYLVSHFAPYLPTSDQIFIRNLAKQNAEPAFSEDGLLIDAKEVAARALFWENFIQQFPHSRYVLDAKYLTESYQQLLFLGTAHLQQQHLTTDLSMSHLTVIKQIAREQSILAPKASDFLNILEQALPSRTISATQTVTLTPSTQQQLQEQLNLDQDLSDYPRDCFHDAICFDKDQTSMLKI